MLRDFDDHGLFEDVDYRSAIKGGGHPSPSRIRNSSVKASAGIDRISLSFQADYSRFGPDFNYCQLLHRTRGHMRLLDLLLDLPTCRSADWRGVPTLLDDVVERSPT
jgi:hypothetical protein